jgi:hypothetical protein
MKIMWRTRYRTLRRVNRFVGWLTTGGGRERVGFYLRYMPSRCVCVFTKW